MKSIRDLSRRRVRDIILIKKLELTQNNEITILFSRILCVQSHYGKC